MKREGSFNISVILSFLSWISISTTILQNLLYILSFHIIYFHIYSDLNEYKLVFRSGVIWPRLWLTEPVGIDTSDYCKRFIFINNVFNI